MVSVKVSDEDLGDLARLDTALLELDLRALSAVKYPDTSVILIRDWRQSGKEGGTVILPNWSAVQETPRRGVGKQLAEPRNIIFMFLSFLYHLWKIKESYLEDQVWRLVIFIIIKWQEIITNSVGSNYLHQDYSKNTIYNLVVVMVAIGKGVDMGIVDQGVVAISPGELLGPKNEKFKVTENATIFSANLMRRWS